MCTHKGRGIDNAEKRGTRFKNTTRAIYDQYYQLSQHGAPAPGVRRPFIFCIYGSANIRVFNGIPAFIVYTARYGPFIYGSRFNMAEFSGKKMPVLCSLVQWHTLEKTLYKWYQKNTAMFNWSPCMNVYSLNDRYFVLFITVSRYNPWKA